MQVFLDLVAGQRTTKDNKRKTTNFTISKEGTLATITMVTTTIKMVTTTVASKVFLLTTEIMVTMGTIIKPVTMDTITTNDMILLIMCKKFLNTEVQEKIKDS